MCSSSPDGGPAASGVAVPATVVDDHVEVAQLFDDPAQAAGPVHRPVDEHDQRGSARPGSWSVTAKDVRASGRVTGGS